MNPPIDLSTLHLETSRFIIRVIVIIVVVENLFITEEERSKDASSITAGSILMMETNLGIFPCFIQELSKRVIMN